MTKCVDDSLAASKFIPDSFVTSKMLEEFDKGLVANGGILFLNKDFNKVTCIANQRHILALDLDKINLDGDNNFIEGDPDFIIHARLLAWHSKFEKHKTLKKR